MAIERGRLPAGWRWSALADVSRIVGGSTPSSSVQEYWNGDILWVTPTDLSAIVGRTIDDFARKITQEGFASAGLERLPAGSVVMSSRAPIGYLAIAGRPLTTNQGCKSFVPSESLIIPDFLYLALSFQMPAIVAAGAGTTFAEVSKSKLELIEIALPAIPEQRRIVAALNERLSALFRAREVAAMQEEEIELLDSCMRESLLSSGAETSLANVARITARLVDPAEPQYRDLPHINGENIEAETGRLGRYQTAADDKVFSQKFKFDKGDVLYSKLRPYLRKAAIAPSDGLCSADMYPLKVSKDRLLPEFLLLELLSDRFSKYAIEEFARSRMPKLNREALFAWKMTLPSTEEQKSIVSKARRSTAALELLRDRTSAQMAQLNTLEPALLRAAFSGAL